MNAMTILLLLIAYFSAPAVLESNVASQKQENSSALAFQKPEPKLEPVDGDQFAPLVDESILERGKQANLPPLKSKYLSEDDIEFRVWCSFGKKPLEGFVIRRIDGQWKGVFLEAMNDINKPPYRRELSPKPGWERLWSRLVDAGLLTLPDSSQWKREATKKDGTSYVVEVKQGSVYRIYSYSDPSDQKWKEAKRMLRIADLLFKGFGIKR